MNPLRGPHMSRNALLGGLLGEEPAPGPLSALTDGGDARLAVPRGLQRPCQVAAHQGALPVDVVVHVRPQAAAQRQRRRLRPSAQSAQPVQSLRNRLSVLEDRPTLRAPARLSALVIQAVQQCRCRPSVPAVLQDLAVPEVPAAQLPRFRLWRLAGRRLRCRPSAPAVRSRRPRPVRPWVRQDRRDLAVPAARAAPARLCRPWSTLKPQIAPQWRRWRQSSAFRSPPHEALRSL